MKSIIYGNNPVNLLDSLYITVVSMLVVFFILILIAYSLNFLKYFNPKEKKDTDKNEIKNIENDIKENNIENNKDEQSYNINYNDRLVRIAIMVATIQASEELGHNNIKIRKVREIS